VSEQFLNGTSAQLGYTVPFTSVQTEKYLTVDMLTLDYFKRSLKYFLFARYWHSAWSTLGICNDSALYKCTLNSNNNNNDQSQPTSPFTEWGW